jgi:hypothetical protein
MLDAAEIEERARYCYCVFLQLSWLLSNDFAEPGRYAEYLAKSSLGLGSDQFIVMTLEEALMENRLEGGLRSLISLYEGFSYAFCQVLEKDIDQIKAQISPGFLIKLAEEMGVELPSHAKTDHNPVIRLTGSGPKGRGTEKSHGGHSRAGGEKKGKEGKQSHGDAGEKKQ